MSDLGQHIWETACAMNRIRAEELRCPQPIATKADTLQEPSTAQPVVPLFSKERREEDIAPTIAKAPLRAELRRLEMFVKIYEEQAIQYQGQAEACKALAQQAQECIENLKRMGDL